LKFIYLYFPFPKAGAGESKRRHFTRFFLRLQGEILMFSQYFWNSAKGQKNREIFRVNR